MVETEQARRARMYRDNQASIYEKRRCTDVLRAREAFGASFCDHSSFFHCGNGDYRVELTMEQFQRILEAAEAGQALVCAARAYVEKQRGALHEGGNR